MLIGIDWGGTKIEGIALTLAGDVLARDREPTPRGDYEGCLAAIARLVERLEETTGERGRIGVGMPGSLDPATGLAKGANSTWLMGRPVHGDLESALGREIRLENDADLLAASEARDGAGAGHRVVFAANLASGTGAGLAIDGRVHRGANNAAAEWGHNPLPYATDEERPGPDCYCGRQGCLETWTSGIGFAADHDRVNGGGLEAPAIVALALDGDAAARASLERWYGRVARGLAVVVNTLDPDVIIVGGGMSNVDELFEVLPDAIGSWAFTSVFRTPIVRAKHGPTSGVRGAAFLWRDDA